MVLPLLNGEYLIKFENEQKLRSANAVSAIINIPDGIPRLNYETLREEILGSKFPGQKAGTFYSDSYDGLALDGDASFDEIPDLDAFTENLDTHFGTQLTRGEYFFQNTISLGAKYSVRMQRILKTRGIYTSDLIDDRTEKIDNWTDFDGALPDDTNVEVYFRKSDGAESIDDFLHEDSYLILLEDGGKLLEESSLEFDDWIPLENNVFVGQTFQFKAVLTTDHVDQTPVVDELGVTLQFERRTESSGLLFSGAASKTVPFENGFYTDADTEVSVGITAFDMQSGDYYRVTNVTGTEFTIAFFDSSNSFISRRFNYVAIGYGTAQV